MIRKRRVQLVAIAAVVLLAAGAWAAWEAASFPGRVEESPYQVEEEGVRSSFRGGVVHRHPGAIPLAEVTGDHYEMGLQYGVLLRPEILSALEDYREILRWMARDMGVPVPLLAAGLKIRTRRMARRLPDRFRDEIRGVARGSGVPEGTVVAVSLLYDVLMTSGCTSVLMRAEGETIVHARSQEPFGFGYGGLLARHTVAVRHRADGYYAVTHLDPPLFLGVETGYSDGGLGFSEETYSIRERHPGGFPIVYLARMALEEASNLEEVRDIVTGVAVAAPGGMVWSDRNQGTGVRIEVTPTAWAAQPLEGSILWDFNDIVDPELAQQQHPRTNLAGFNRDRELLASSFPLRPEYGVEDAVAFLRSRHAPDGRDFAWLGTRGSIANAWGQQMVVFDPQGDGFYLALGETFAALREVVRFRDDFSRPPERFMDAVALGPVVEEAARIRTGLLGREERLRGYVELAGRHPDDANAQFLAVLEAFEQGKPDVFMPHAERAASLAPHVPEYRLYLGLSAYRRGDWAGAIEHLEEAEASGSGHGRDGASPEQEVLRLTALEAAWAERDPRKAAAYSAARHALLESHDAAEYFEAHLHPRLWSLAGLP